MILNSKHKTYILILIGAMVVSFFLFSQTTQAACTNVPLSGDYTVSESCTFSASAGVFGVDDGNLIIASGQTLTINNGQTVVWGPGKSVIINGTIAINEGGQLKQARIWYKEADGDGYPSTSTPIAQIDSPGEDYVYRSEFATGTWVYTSDLAYDYDDTDNTVYPGTACGGGDSACSVNEDDGTCTIYADGTVCGSCSTCSGDYSDTCDETCDGTQTCDACSAGKCTATTSQSCSCGTRDTDGTRCWTGSWSSCGSCQGYTDNCDTCDNGTQSRDYKTCSAGSCSVINSESQDCCCATRTYTNVVSPCLNCKNMVSCSKWCMDNGYCGCIKCVRYMLAGCSIIDKDNISCDTTYDYDQNVCKCTCTIAQ